MMISAMVLSAIRKLLFGLCLPLMIATSQNLDLLEVNQSGIARGMAGSGIATISGPSAYDLNPAGIAFAHTISFLGSASYTEYAYSILSETKTLPSLNHYWYTSRIRFDNAQVLVPIGNTIVLGTGYVRKMSPFLSNDRRAITGSALFTEETKGDINAFSLAAGVSLMPGLTLGGSIYRLKNSVQSDIQGDLHGKDSDKWARLRNNIQGTMARFGVQGTLGGFRWGITFVPPYELDITSEKSISSDNQYANLFPSYNTTTWRIGGSVGAGLGYSNNSSATATIDLRLHRFEQSETEFNLYEYGSRPNWKNLLEMRAGIECYPFESAKIPIRFGYSYVPQLYASIEAQGVNNSNILQILDYRILDQNVLHTLTAGTSFIRGDLTVHLSIEYAFLKAFRNVTGSFITIDEYKERRLSLFIAIEYNSTIQL